MIFFYIHYDKLYLKPNEEYNVIKYDNQFQKKKKKQQQQKGKNKHKEKVHTICFKNKHTS